MATTQGLRGKFKDLLKKYGKVALGVHFSVSAASISGLYIAIKNNADIESLFDRYHIPGVFKDDKESSPEKGSSKDEEIGLLRDEKKKKGVAELAASSGGALALAVLCNKALFPVRAPITVVLTPPVARFLARRRIVNGI